MLLFLSSSSHISSSTFCWRAENHFITFHIGVTHHFTYLNPLLIKALFSLCFVFALAFGLAKNIVYKRISEKRQRKNCSTDFRLRFIALASTIDRNHSEKGNHFRRHRTLPLAIVKTSFVSIYSSILFLFALLPLSTKKKTKSKRFCGKIVQNLP